MKPAVANQLLLLAGAIWGLGFVAQQTAMDDVGPMFFVGARFILAGLVILPFALVEGRRLNVPLSGSHFVQFAGIGVIFFLAMAMQQVGLLRTTVTNAGFLTVLYVVIVPVISWLFLRESQPIAIWIAAVCSVAGVYLLSTGDLSNLNWGDGCVLAAAFVWALHVVVIGRVLRNVQRAVALAATQFLVCGFLGLIAQTVLSIAGTSVWPTWSAIQAASLEIVYAGIVSGGIAFTLQAVAQRYTSAAVASILMASESLFAALLAAVILHERLALLAYIGCGLIFVSILAAEWYAPEFASSEVGPDVR